VETSKPDWGRAAPDFRIRLRSRQQIRRHNLLSSSKQLRQRPTTETAHLRDPIPVSGRPRGNTGNGSGYGNGQMTPSYTCGGREYVLEQPGSDRYYCLIFYKIWLTADDRLTSPPSGASVRLGISLNDEFLGSFECTDEEEEEECVPLAVFLANFDPDRAVLLYRGGPATGRMAAPPGLSGSGRRTLRQVAEPPRPASTTTVHDC
jgi:hypothetical protein